MDDFFDCSEHRDYWDYSEYEARTDEYNPDDYSSDYFEAESWEPDDYSDF